MGRDIRQVLRQGIGVMLVPTDSNRDFFAGVAHKVFSLYAEMDRAFETVAGRYGFRCSGCDRNCCEELFYHYTLAEHIALAEGFTGLAEKVKQPAADRAEEVLAKYRIFSLSGMRERVMCPLNSEGRCILYSSRPMTCRLHGIPHTVRKPGSDLQHGPGCHVFEESFGPRGYDHELDRTGLYAGLAALEAKIRKELRFSGRYRKTIAEMIVESVAA